MICKISIDREIYTKIGIIIKKFLYMFIANRKVIFIYCWFIIDYYWFYYWFLVDLLWQRVITFYDSLVITLQQIGNCYNNLRQVL